MDKKIANLYDTGNVDKAIHLLIEKINKHPQDIENYLQLSTYLIEQNAADQALELLEKARGLVKHPEDQSFLIHCLFIICNGVKQRKRLGKISLHVVADSNVIG